MTCPQYIYIYLIYHTYIDCNIWNIHAGLYQAGMHSFLHSLVYIPLSPFIQAAEKVIVQLKKKKTAELEVLFKKMIDLRAQIHMHAWNQQRLGYIDLIHASPSCFPIYIHPLRVHPRLPLPLLLPRACPWSRRKRLHRPSSCSPCFGCSSGFKQFYLSQSQGTWFMIQEFQIYNRSFYKFSVYKMCMPTNH